MRNMSFRLTTRQFSDGSKDVIRRLGWADLKAGEHFTAVEKSQGLRKGEKVNYLGQCICHYEHSRTAGRHYQATYQDGSGFLNSRFPENRDGT